MSKLTEQAYDPNFFRNEGHRLVDLLADYLSGCISEKPIQVLPVSSPDESFQYWQQAFNAPDFDLQMFFVEVIKQSNHIHHPHYVGHQVVPSAPVAALTELLSAFLNNGMAIYEMGPAATAIERVIIAWLAQHFGMNEQAGGVLTSGGSAGNLTGLLAARQAMCTNNVWEEGNTVEHQLAVMVSEEAHYSVSRAVRIMGWGEHGIVKIPVNQHLQADITMLDQCLAEAIEKGIKVIAVVGNACSTSTGAYDNLGLLADFARKHKLWFHVDGAHGAAAIFSEKYRHLLEGIEKADSVVIDFHKMMLTPALTTAVVFRDAGHSFETFAQKAEYLLSNGSQKPWYDGAARTLECTKKMMGLKIYALIKQYGPQLFEDYVTQAYDLGQEFASLLITDKRFELAIWPQSNIVCFRYNPKGSTLPVNDFTASLRASLLQDASFYVVQTQVRGETYLRVTLMNPFTTLTHLKTLLETVVRLASEMLTDDNR